jgi:hypothetical protein
MLFRSVFLACLLVFDGWADIKTELPALQGGQ